jgi:hypothetical protein
LEEPRKRIGDIRHILERLEVEGIPFELLLAGSGADEAWLRADLAAMTGCGKVRFLGCLDAVTLHNEVYAVCDALLTTSSWETGPLVVWESLRAGVPVVASRYVGSGLERALKHNETALLFPVGDVAAAAVNLARLWREPELCRELEANGMALVESRYSVNVSIDAWAAALQAALTVEPLPGAVAAEVVPIASGRLDRCFGARLGETIRQFLGRTGPMGEAGGEWPHWSGESVGDEDGFWRLAEELDAVPG